MDFHSLGRISYNIRIVRPMHDTSDGSICMFRVVFIIRYLYTYSSNSWIHPTDLVMKHGKIIIQYRFNRFSLTQKHWCLNNTFFLVGWKRELLSCPSIAEQASEPAKIYQSPSFHVIRKNLITDVLYNKANLVSVLLSFYFFRKINEMLHNSRYM